MTLDRDVQKVTEMIKKQSGPFPRVVEERTLDLDDRMENVCPQCDNDDRDADDPVCVGCRVNVTIFRPSNWKKKRSRGQSAT